MIIVNVNKMGVNNKKRCSICGMRTCSTVKIEDKKYTCCEVCIGKYSGKKDGLTTEILKGRFKK